MGPPAPHSILQTHQTCALQNRNRPSSTPLAPVATSVATRTSVRQRPDGSLIGKGLSTPRTKNHPNGGFLLCSPQPDASKASPARSFPPCRSGLIDLLGGTNEDLVDRDVVRAGDEIRDRVR